MSGDAASFASVAVAVSSLGALAVSFGKSRRERRTTGEDIADKQVARAQALSGLSNHVHEQQIAVLTEQLTDLQQKITELQRENAALRQSPPESPAPP